VIGIKSFAELLIDSEDDVIPVETPTKQSLRTIWGLIDFVTSAEDLFLSGDLTREDYATLVNAIFAGQSLVQALYHLYQNRTFRYEYGWDESLAESIHLRDLLRVAKNPCLSMPQDSSMLNKPSSAAAITSVPNDFEQAQHESDNLNIIITVPYKKIQTVSNANAQPDVHDAEWSRIRNNFYKSILECKYLPSIAPLKPRNYVCFDIDDNGITFFSALKDSTFKAKDEKNTRNHASEETRPSAPPKPHFVPSASDKIIVDVNGGETGALRKHDEGTVQNKRLEAQMTEVAKEMKQHLEERRMGLEGKAAVEKKKEAEEAMKVAEEWELIVKLHGRQHKKIKAEVRGGAIMTSLIADGINGEAEYKEIIDKMIDTLPVAVS